MGFCNTKEVNACLHTGNSGNTYSVATTLLCYNTAIILHFFHISIISNYLYRDTWVVRSFLAAGVEQCAKTSFASKFRSLLWTILFYSQACLWTKGFLIFTGIYSRFFWRANGRGKVKRQSSTPKSSINRRQVTCTGFALLSPSEQNAQRCKAFLSSSAFKSRPCWELQAEGSFPLPACTAGIRHLGTIFSTESLYTSKSYWNSQPRRKVLFTKSFGLKKVLGPSPNSLYSWVCTVRSQRNIWSHLRRRD